MIEFADINQTEQSKNNYLNTFIWWYENTDTSKSENEKYFDFIQIINENVINSFISFLETKNIKIENHFKLIREFNNNNNYFFDWIENLM